jgi:predicted Ser/Thr protein kinase
VTKFKSRDNEQQKKCLGMIEMMVHDYGYAVDSAEEIIAFASNNLWRDL